MDEIAEAPGPLALFRRIPQWIRWYIYSAVATAVAVEGVLELAGAGVIPDRIQAIALGILSLFGFTMAAANTGVQK